MYRFLLSGKWLVGFLACVLASLLCLYLGSWQWDRKEALDYKNSLVTTNYHADPLSIEDHPDLFSEFNADNQWHPVTMRGEYLQDHQLLVRNRPYEGLNGYELLVPFKTEAGQIVVVNRGWIQAKAMDATQSTDIPATPHGNMTIVVRLHSPEAHTGKDAPQGQISSINLEDYSQVTGLQVSQGAYGLLASEDPAPAISPAKAPEPDLDIGPNLSYAVQWAVFALMCYFAYFWLARQKVRNDEIDAQVAEEIEAYYQQFYDAEGNYVGEEDEAVVQRKMEMVDDMPAHLKSIMRPKISKKRNYMTDEEEEDALLDEINR